MIQSLVLLHSPLVGPMTWQATAAALEAKGCRARVPSLAGVVEQGPPYNRKLAGAAAEEIADFAAQEPVGLVVHSAAGSLVPSIVALGKRGLSAVLFVDAVLPHPGTSRMRKDPSKFGEMIKKLAREGWLPPWHEWFPPGALAEILPDADLRERFIAELRPIPLDYFQENAPVDQAWVQLPCAYLQLSEAYGKEVGEAARLGWPTHRLMSDHLAMLTRPEEVADAMVTLLGALV
jgi:hypothetical protein